MRFWLVYQVLKNYGKEEKNLRMEDEIEWQFCREEKVYDLIGVSKRKTRTRTNIPA